MDTEYKQYSPTKHIGIPAAGAVSAPAPLMCAPYEAAIRPPGVLAAARRILMSQHMGGADAFFVPSSTPGVGHVYPAEGDSYMAAEMSYHVTAGNYLELRVIAVPSGACEESDGAGGWFASGAAGGVRVEHVWNTGGDTNSPNDVVATIPPSQLDDYAEWDGFGGLWSTLEFRYLPNVAPTCWPIGTAAEVAKHSEWVPVDAKISQDASARVVHAALSEVARNHVTVDTETAATTHGWSHYIPLPEEYPQEEGADGATYEEHRFGVHRALHAATLQAERMGPMVYSWSAHSDAMRDLGDTRPDPFTVTSSTYVWIHDSGVTAWDADRPGFAVSASYAQRYRDCDPDLVLRGRAASIPVRVRVRCNFSGAGANTLTIKVQVTARSLLTLEIAQSVTLAEYTTTGYLESDRAGDDTYTVGMVFAKTTGGTAQIYGVGVEFSEIASV